MKEEIYSLIRLYERNFHVHPSYVIIGQDQFNNLMKEVIESNILLFKVSMTNHFLGLKGYFEGLNVVVVTSDILEVV